MLWGSNIQASPEQDSRRNPWHDDRYVANEREEVGTSGAHLGDSSSSNSDGVDRSAGGWGEHDAGRINTHDAAEDLHALREELAAISRTRSHGNPPERNEGLFKTLSRKSTGRPSAGGNRRRSTATLHTEDDKLTDTEDFDAVADEKDDGFELSDFMKEGHFEKRTDGQSAKKVGVVFKNLTVKGVGSTATFVRTLPDAVLGTFGPDLYHLVTRWIPALKLGRRPPTRTLINDFSGVVKDGEMMLVLGRPGSGCSTFLKAVANDRESYASVEGDVSYGGIPADKQKKQFLGEVNYNPEDDTHMANLTVWQTLSFALMNKTKKSEKGDIPIILEALLKIFGIQHTKNTLVGDEYVRGVSFQI